MSSKKTIDKAIILSLLYLFVMLVVYVIFRNVGLYPSVFSDELSYSKFARVVSFSEASLPNYFYYFIYRITNECGNGFLECSKIINVVFYSLSVPIIYLIGRFWCSKKISLFIAVISFAGASNTYTAYFMPEAMYYLSFWVVSWIALSLRTESNNLRWLALGFSVGISSLIKPHALFLLPALCVYAYYIVSGFTLRYLKQSFYAVILIVLAAVLTKLTLGYLFAGKSGLTLFGTFYAPYAEAAVNPGLSHYISMAKHTAFSLSGHVISILFLYSLPVALLLASMIRIFICREQKAFSHDRLAVYTFLVLGVLILISALYTASISDFTPSNHLHIRYYFFALPLLLIFSAATFGQGDIPFAKKLVLGFPIVAALIFVIFTEMRDFEMYSSTAPELYGVVDNKVILKVIALLAIACVVTWIISLKNGLASYLFIFLPVMTACSLAVVSDEISKRKTPDIYDISGMYARDHLSQSDRNSTVIVGDESAVGGLFRTLFYLDTPNLNYLKVNAKDSEIFGLKPNAELNVDVLSKSKRYLIVIGSHPIIGDTAIIYCDSAFCIRKIGQ